MLLESHQSPKAVETNSRPWQHKLTVGFQAKATNVLSRTGSRRPLIWSPKLLQLEIWRHCQCNGLPRTVASKNLTKSPSPHARAVPLLKEEAETLEDEWTLQLLCSFDGWGWSTWNQQCSSQSETTSVAGADMKLKNGLSNNCWNGHIFVGFDAIFSLFSKRFRKGSTEWSEESNTIPPLLNPAHHTEMGLAPP